jgi:hypothetical protein
MPLDPELRSFLEQMAGVSGMKVSNRPVEDRRLESQMLQYSLLPGLRSWETVMPSPSPKNAAA